MNERKSLLPYCDTHGLRVDGKVDRATGLPVGCGPDCVFDARNPEVALPCETCGSTRDPETGWCPHTDAECDKRAGLRDTEAVLADECDRESCQSIANLADGWSAALVRVEAERDELRTELKRLRKERTGLRSFVYQRWGAPALRVFDDSFAIRMHQEDTTNE